MTKNTYVKQEKIKNKIIQPEYRTIIAMMIFVIVSPQSPEVHSKELSF